MLTSIQQARYASRLNYLIITEHSQPLLLYIIIALNGNHMAKSCTVAIYRT